MKTALRQRALELGFDECRFTTAEPPASGRHLESWLAEKRHGEMAWLERNAAKRLNPQLVLPGARSAIMLAVNYAWEQPVPGGAPRASAPPLRTSDLGLRTSTAAPRGLIARYARQEDYHDRLGPPLKTLADFVNELGGTGTRSLWYVDTGPILERDLAQRAGLGFVGKHTHLVSRRFGNWLLLAEILTTLELEPDAPEQNRCGSCTRCLAACPTGAITAPFQLDARRCLSYLTIELKGSIPVELRAAIGNRIFGCDDCLAACPWNRFAVRPAVVAHDARTDLATPDLRELLALDETGFKARFAGTPILRAKRRGLLRNVCVALGNVGDRRALAALESVAADPEPLLREHAAWAITQIHSRRTMACQPAADLAQASAETTP